MPPVAGAVVAFATGAAPSSRAAIAAIVAAARAVLIVEYDTYDDDNETAAGLAVSVNWQSVYAPHEGFYTPVFRGDPWGLGPFGIVSHVASGPHSVRAQRAPPPTPSSPHPSHALAPPSQVMFEWDGMMTSILATQVSGARWAGISNVVRMTRSGNVPGYVLGHWEGLCGEKNSKPPLGALALFSVATTFQADAAWLVPLLLEPLLMWNRWWWTQRQFGGLIAPGGLDTIPDYACASQSYDGLTSSKFETGLDNSPLFDAAEFVTSTSTMNQVDAGMSAMYAVDCTLLATLARTAGHAEWAAELFSRAATVVAAMQATLWQPVGDGSGRSLFFNRNFSVAPGGGVTWGNRIAIATPPNLYPLWTGVPTMAQAEAIVLGYLANASEFCVNATARAMGACGGAVPSMPSVARSSQAFHDNNYWRGRSWAPMNFLTYQALESYADSSAIIAAARAELAEQSRAAFLANWVGDRHIMENHNSQSAAGCDVGNAMSIYSWGALDALIALNARGKGPPPPSLPPPPRSG